jgi:hypothetical protein
VTVRAHDAKPIEECERFPEKKRFDLQSEADASAQSALARDGLRLYSFPCSACGGFHLSKEKR